MIDIQSLSVINVRLPLFSEFTNFCQIFYKILFEITIQIVRQSIPLCYLFTIAIFEEYNLPCCLFEEVPNVKG